MGGTGWVICKSIVQFGVPLGVLTKDCWHPTISHEFYWKKHPSRTSYFFHWLTKKWA